MTQAKAPDRIHRRLRSEREFMARRYRFENEHAGRSADCYSVGEWVSFTHAVSMSSAAVRSFLLRPYFFGALLNGSGCRWRWEWGARRSPPDPAYRANWR